MIRCISKFSWKSVYRCFELSKLYSTLGFRDRMISGVLENIIFLELKRRGYQPYVGKLGNKEIDFVAERKGQKIYIQVAYKIESNETAKLEVAPLLAIKDQYPKYVITILNRDNFKK